MDALHDKLVISMFHYFYYLAYASLSLCLRLNSSFLRLFISLLLEQVTLLFLLGTYRPRNMLPQYFKVECAILIYIIKNNLPRFCLSDLMVV